MFPNIVASELNDPQQAPQNAREKAKIRWFDASEGPYKRLPALTPEQAADLRLAVSRSGWKINLQRAAFYIIDTAEKSWQGQRFQLSRRDVGNALGMSPTSGGRYLKQLREKGLIQMFREHRVYVDDEGDFWGVAAVNEINPYLLTERDHPPTDSDAPQVRAISEPLST